jgi:hypothetical protein
MDERLIRGVAPQRRDQASLPNVRRRSRGSLPRLHLTFSLQTQRLWAAPAMSDVLIARLSPLPAPYQRVSSYQLATMNARNHGGPRARVTEMIVDNSENFCP